MTRRKLLAMMMAPRDSRLGGTSRHLAILIARTTGLSPAPDFSQLEFQVAFLELTEERLQTAAELNMELNTR